MRIIHKNLRKNIVKMKIESLDDLWYLSHIIDSGDLIRGKTIRKIKIQKENQKTQISKKTTFLEIQVERIEFHKHSNILRASGTITQELKDIQKGDHHTFNLEPGKIIEIQKKQWLNYQIEKLNQSVEEKEPKILILVFDREEAYFALNKRQNYELLSGVKGEVEKKSIQVQINKKFYPELIKLLEEYDQRYKPENIIVASPAFWKEELLKEVSNQELKKKIVLATCSSVKENAINEVLKRPEVKNILKKDRILKEIHFVEELLKEIKIDGKSAYGLKETKNATDAGAVETLLITDSFIQKMRQQEMYKEIDAILELVDKNKGKIIFISSENEAGQKLDSLGGIGAILRYKLNY